MHNKPTKIGLFTSPHLCWVRDRFRINSAVLSEESFTHYFFQVLERLNDSLGFRNIDETLARLKKEESLGYFAFLTLLSFHIFIQEGVEAAIYEVGVGGENDATNIISRPAVTGITSLGYDHLRTLGNSIEEIAWHKAGIIKPGCPSFTVPQEMAAEQVIKQRAREKGSTLSVVSVNTHLHSISFPNSEQASNASLALDLANKFLERPRESISQQTITAIRNCQWPGRSQYIAREDVEWYIDGAHTNESIEACVRWFSENLNNSTSQPQPKRLLIFNHQSMRDRVALLRAIQENLDTQKVKLHLTVFCTHKTYQHRPTPIGMFLFPCKNSDSC